MEFNIIPTFEDFLNESQINESTRSVAEIEKDIKETSNNLQHTGNALASIEKELREELTKFCQDFDKFVGITDLKSKPNSSSISMLMGTKEVFVLNFRENYDFKTNDEDPYQWDESYINFYTTTTEFKNKFELTRLVNLGKFVEKTIENPKFKTDFFDRFVEINKVNRLKRKEFSHYALQDTLRKLQDELKIVQFNEVCKVGHAFETIPFQYQYGNKRWDSYKDVILIKIIKIKPTKILTEFIHTANKWDSEVPSPHTPGEKGAYIDKHISHEINLTKNELMEIWNVRSKDRQHLKEK